VLSGAGGVGKTQVAARYARTRWAAGDVDLLLWLTAANRESVITEYARAAIVVGAPRATDTETMARGFISWMAVTQRIWLVVLDDLADPGDLRGLWPPSHPRGRTVVTTRRRDAALTGTGRCRAEVEVFAPVEAAAYVSAKLAIHGRSDDPAHIAELAQDMGFLPVALAQAMAYLVDTELDCARYRRRWADRRRTLPKLVPQPGSLPDDQSVGLAAVWSLSVQRASSLEPVGLAGPMLDLISLLDPNGIPLKVLTAPPALAYLAAYRAPAPSEDGDISIEAADALAALARLSLCTLDPKVRHREVRVHALVQRACRENLSPRRFAEAAQAAADALAYAWPEVGYNAQLAPVLHGNVEYLAAEAQDVLCQSFVHPVLVRTGLSIGEAGLDAEAGAYFARLSETSAACLGPDHPDTMVIRRHAARWQAPVLHADATIAACEGLLADQLRVLGRDHADTLATRRLLAFWRGFRNPSGAVAEFVELLSHCQRVLGPTHLDTLTTRRELAHQLGRAGRAGAAILAFEELLADQIRVLGPDHPESLETRYHMCYALVEAGDTAGATLAYEELLADQIRVLGPDHPRNLLTRAHIGAGNVMAGDAAAGIAALETLVADQIRILGPDHHDTLHARYDLARGRGEAGDTVGAVRALEELLADLVRVLGPDSHHTLEALDDLARWQADEPDDRSTCS
jgi:hypothetical protein